MHETERYAYPVEGATKMVYFVHGYGDRAGRYLEFADYLNKHGISFYAHDMLGFGKSGPVNGMMAHCEIFDDYVDEVINEIHAIKTKNPQYKKVVLLGHSMGGLVAFRVSNRVQLTGLVLSAPLLEVNRNAAPLLLSMVSVLAYFAPNQYLSLDLSKPEWFSGDPVVQQESKNDKHMWHGSLRFGHALKIMEAAEKSRDLWKHHYTRTVILHCPDDMLCKIEGSRALSAARPDLVTLHEVQNSCHGLLKDVWKVRSKTYALFLDAIQAF